ncbi:MAG TPA: long-chain fatty acid--CoA ligase [Spirochaetota bacterium]|nr:long-chain fatty acid--CoA ligase [Spirochaetota bacterium]
MAQFKSESMSAVFQEQAAKLGSRACVSYKKGDQWADISWTDMNTMIHNIAYYLMSEGIKKGDRVAIFAPNRWEWWVASLATTSIGAVSVPIYATNSSEEAQYVLEHSGSSICFVGTEDHADRVLKVIKKCPKLDQLIIFDDLSKKKQGVITFKEALEKGAKKAKPADFDKRLKSIKRDDLSTLIYTSGTTGNPKGVMLSHYNFFSNVRNIMVDMGKFFSVDDIWLSFLPLSHSLEMTTGYYGPIWAGAKTAFAESIEKLVINFTEVRPTVIISVPRIYEKVHAGILAKFANESGLKKAIFNFALNTAKKNLPHVCRDIPRKGLFAIQFNVADKLVFSKLKAAIGLDRLRYAISGGAPLAVSDAEFFIGMGLKILEGYGLTETTPVITYNRPWFIKPGTVGQAIPETKVKIADDGEILVKGPQVMLGYYKNKAATEEVMTKDGYFKTGDIGVIDEDGCLKITGRIKDIIVTAGGKNISPQNIENSVKESPYIEELAVIGDKRKYLSALVIPDFEAVGKWAKQKGIKFANNADLIKNEEVIQLIGNEIAKYTKQYSRVEQIKKFTLLEAVWTQETGELTPTQKVKRKVIEQKYAKEINAMYPPDLD